MREEKRDLAFRFYIADSAKAAVGNLANFSGGSVINKHFSDILNELDSPQKKERYNSAEEIIDNIKSKLSALSE